MGLVKDVYLHISDLPHDERFGLNAQIKRSAISIPSNIAEGAGRGSNQDFSRFLNISLGSAYELETQIILSSDLGLMRSEISQKLILLINEVQKMIHGLLKKLRSY